MIDPYLSGCKASDPVPEILARNSLLMNSLVLPTQTNEHDQSATADDGHKKQTLREHRVKYVYVPVLKELILVSVALRSDKLSQCFYSCLDGMLSLCKVTPPPPQH